MDPNETLNKLRNAASAWVEIDGEDPDYGDEMAELFQDIDKWLSNGGFYPTAWCNGLEQMFRSGSE